MSPPSKPHVERPVDEERLSDDVLTREGTPITGVRAVECVVTHHQILVGRHDELKILIVKECHVEGAILGIYMTHIAVFRPKFLNTALGIPPMRFVIDLGKMRRRGIQSDSVNANVPIVADLNRFTRKADQSLDVVLVIGHARIADAFGLEDYDVATRGTPEIVGHPIHEEVVTTRGLHLDDVIAYFVAGMTLQVSSVEEPGVLPKILWREPYGVHLVIDLKPLAQVEEKETRGW